MYKTYDDVIRKQIKEGIVEIAPQRSERKEHYIPHKPVIKETAETTKLCIVYDASAKANDKSPSLNECLENWATASEKDPGYSTQSKRDLSAIEQ